MVIFREQTTSGRFNKKEYAEEPYFYGNLLEGYKRELDIFACWKKLIDEENVAC